jgi:hypothetical protein
VLRYAGLQMKRHRYHFGTHDSVAGSLAAPTGRWVFVNGWVHAKISCNGPKDIPHEIPIWQIGRRAPVANQRVGELRKLAYAVAEGAVWRGSLADRAGLSREFYTVIAVGLALGLALDYAGFNAVSMLFWAAVLNGVLAPPLIVIVLLLTSNRAVMGSRSNPRWLAVLGWVTVAVMTAASCAMFATWK